MSDFVHFSSTPLYCCFIGYIVSYNYHFFFCSSIEYRGFKGYERCTITYHNKKYIVYTSLPIIDFLKLDLPCRESWGSTNFNENIDNTPTFLESNSKIEDIHILL